MMSYLLFARRSSQNVRTTIGSWIKDFNLFSRLWVDVLLSGAFPKRTRYASQSQIFSGCFSARCEWNNVVNVKSCFLTFLRQAAVFTSILPSFDYKLSQENRNMTRTHLPLATRSDLIRINESISANSTSPSASFFSLADNLSPRSCLSRSAWRRASTPRGKRIFSGDTGISILIRAFCPIRFLF
jgi:hypothetical protein